MPVFGQPSIRRLVDLRANAAVAAGAAAPDGPGGAVPAVVVAAAPARRAAMAERPTARTQAATGARQAAPVATLRPSPLPAPHALLQRVEVRAARDGVPVAVLPAAPFQLARYYSRHL